MAYFRIFLAFEGEGIRTAAHSPLSEPGGPRGPSETPTKRRREEAGGFVQTTKVYFGIKDSDFGYVTYAYAGCLNA